MPGVIPALHPATIAALPTLTAYLDAAQQAGFRYADFNMAAAAQMADSSNVDAVVNAFASRGLTAGGWGAGVRLPASDTEFTESLQKLVLFVEIAAAIGSTASLVVVPNRAEGDRSDVLRIWADRIARVADITARRGIDVGLEFIGPNLWPSLPTTLPDDMLGTLELADQTGRANVGLLFDMYHFHCGSSRMEDIQACRGRIVHVHLNDAPPGDARTFDDSVRRLPGEGVIDLQAIATELEVAGYNGAGGVEIFDPDLRALPATEGARRVAEACKRVFGHL